MLQRRLHLRRHNLLSGRKRKLPSSSLPSRRSARLSSEQPAPGSGTGAPPESATQPGQVTAATTTIANGCLPRDLIVYSFHEPNGFFWEAVLMMELPRPARKYWSGMRVAPSRWGKFVEQIYAPGSFVSRSVSCNQKTNRLIQHAKAPARIAHSQKVQYLTNTLEWKK